MDAPLMMNKYHGKQFVITGVTDPMPAEPQAAAGLKYNYTYMAH